MNIITIPKQTVAKDDLVIVPRKEYETLLNLKTFKTFTATPRIKRTLRRAEKNLKLGKTLTLNELKRKLEITNVLQN